MPVYIWVIFPLALFLLLAAEAFGSKRKKAAHKKQIQAAFCKPPALQDSPSAPAYYNQLDSRTCGRLWNLDSVFARINTCQSSVSASVLYDLLHHQHPQCHFAYGGIGL